MFLTAPHVFYERIQHVKQPLQKLTLILVLCVTERQNVQLIHMDVKAVKHARVQHFLQFCPGVCVYTFPLIILQGKAAMTK
jgi:hypothetical protein